MRKISRCFSSRPDLAACISIALEVAKPPAVVHALDEVDLQIRSGEVLGLAGESGRGKSTLGRIAAGILLPSEDSFLSSKQAQPWLRSENLSR